MENQINTYLAMFIISIVATFAAAIIVSVVRNNSHIILTVEPESYTVLSS